MTPIINPWIFYFMSVEENLSIICILFVIVTVIAIIVNKINATLDLEDYKPKKIVIVMLCIATACTILIPSQSTMTKMLVAQNVTYERIEIVGDTVEDIYNDIISLVDNNESEDE